MPKISQERMLARRRGIIQAAARCLQRNGLEGTGMRQLFRAANLSPGAVYRYFASKEELLAAVAEATPGVAATALAGGDDAPDAEALLRRLLSEAAAAPPPARLQLELQSAALRSPLVAAALAERRAEEHRALGRALRRAGAEAEDAVVELVAELCEGLARRRLLEPTFDAEAAVAAAERALRAAGVRDEVGERAG